ncbi:hypothetical protein HMPREF1400_01692 [Helicobacter pylori GAM119Bi]|nr:hypothetical protein HMPREF1400_01692 [Helicobacter pylori GAM119Bi]
MKISLFYYQNTCDFKPLSTMLQDLRYFYIGLLGLWRYFLR